MTWEREKPTSMWVIARMPISSLPSRFSRSPLVGDVDYDPPVSTRDTEDPER